MGGKRNERKKWTISLKKNSIIFYFVSLSDYACMLEEDEKTNRMKESLEEWKKIVSENDPTKLFLIFTKNDLLKLNVDDKISLSQTFPDYKDGLNHQKMYKYIQDLFTHENIRVADFTINCLNSKDVAKLYEDISKIIHGKRIINSGTKIEKKRRTSLGDIFSNMFKKNEPGTSSNQLENEISSKYKTVSHLGSGGQGSIYLVEDSEKKQFVMKRIDIPSFDLVNVSLNEVKSLYELKKHPNINQIIDFGIEKRSSFSQEQQYILVVITNLCEGGDLANKIKQFKKEKKMFQEEVIYSYLKQLISALEFIHKENYIHGDLKPNNIFLDKSHQNLSIGDL